MYAKFEVCAISVTYWPGEQTLDPHSQKLNEVFYSAVQNTRRCSGLDAEPLGMLSLTIDLDLGGYPVDLGAILEVLGPMVSSI